MSFMDPIKFRKEYHYAIDRNFNKEGVEAAWADGHPTIWGSEASRMIFDEPITAGAFSTDDILLALGVNKEIYIYSTESMKLCDILRGATENIHHLEWLPIPEREYAYILVSNSYNTSHGNSQFIFWPLDGKGHFAGGPLGRTPNTHALAGIAAKEIGDLLQSRYFWNKDEAESKDIVNGFVSVLEKAALNHNISCLTDFEGRVPGFGMAASSRDGKSLLYLSQSESSNMHGGGAIPYINVWDIVARQNRFKLEGHSDKITWAGFNPDDDSTIGSSSWDQTVKLWSADTGKLLRSLGPTGGQNWSAAFSPDGQFIAAGCGAHNVAVWIWSVGLGTVYHIVQDFPKMTRTLAWSPDSSFLAMGAAGGAVRILHVESMIVVQDWRLEMGSSAYRFFTEIGNMSWIDEGRKICFTTGTDLGVEVYDVGKNVKWRFAPSRDAVINRGAASDVLWNKSKRLLVTLGQDCVVRFWKLD